ncbi:hypothetical protein [Microbacterium esteraromaticum]
MLLICAITWGSASGTGYAHLVKKVRLGAFCDAAIAGVNVT